MAKRDDPIDALFRLPLTEFIGARKELAARLKKNGYADEAQGVKALAKPSISAWTVNQVYWNHRDEFDELISTGQRFRKAQASGKMANMREALDARREALAQLSDLATEILRDGGHNPSLDVLRRITTTLEALSSLASFSDETTPGRLTQDIDPPGFDSFGSLTPSATPKPTPVKAVPKKAVPKKAVSASASARTKQERTAAAEAGHREDRQAKIDAAKASLQNAKKALTAAHAQKKSLEAAQKRAAAAEKEAAKQKLHAEERLKKANVASAEAADRAQNIAVELAEATKALEDAKRAVESATRNLETSFREAP
jgi:hypothetical protein